jgi:protein tyrosine phosphatase
MVVGESTGMIGLHQHETAVFRRFRWVIPGRLARSSAPHYNGHDEDQNMDQEAVDFLVGQEITNVISFNGYPLSREEIDRLKSRGISYHHIALPDYTAPTLAQLETLRSCYTAGGPTLIYCGFGQGRTGTAISALQLYDGRSMVETDYKDNGVETPDQIKVLNDLKNKLEQ